MSEQPVKRGQGQSLTADEKAQLSTRALELSGRGASKAQIARELSVTPETVGRLLKFAADQVDGDEKARVRASIEASVMAVKRRAWTELDRRKPLTDAQKRAGMKEQAAERIIQPTSHTLPALLARILEADDRLIRLYGLDQPDSDDQPTESLADQMKAYEEAKRTGKVADITGGVRQLQAGSAS